MSECMKMHKKFTLPGIRNNLQSASSWGPRNAILYYRYNVTDYERWFYTHAKYVCGRTLLWMVKVGESVRSGIMVLADNPWL